MKDRSFNKLVQLLETVDPTLNQNPAPAQAMEEDHEVNMAESQIDEIVRNAARIKEMLKTLPSNADIEAWIQSKLTLADDYLVSVAGAMANDFKGVDLAEKNEEMTPLSGKKVDIKQKMAELKAKRAGEVKPSMSPALGASRPGEDPYMSHSGRERLHQQLRKAGVHGGLYTGD